MQMVALNLAACLHLLEEGDMQECALVAREYVRGGLPEFFSCGSGVMLSRFRKAKAAEIAALREQSAQGTLPPVWYGHRPSFAARLRSRGPGALIAEYKRASPSLGDINLELGPRDAARIFAENGAAAMSVLTEEVHFKGSLDYLGSCAGEALPLLRKDFLFDPLQVDATAATPASAYLLVVRMFGGSEELGR